VGKSSKSRDLCQWSLRQNILNCVITLPTSSLSSTIHISYNFPSSVAAMPPAGENSYRIDHLTIWPSPSPFAY